MAKSSAFWREVIDQLPGLVFIFRVDEHDAAHLIFSNQIITDLLGYTAKEYVLKSESAGVIADELEKLIDEIARRSHDIDELSARFCTLTSKSGNPQVFNIHFNLFSTSTQKSNLIAVILRPVKNRLENEPESNPKKELQTEANVDVVGDARYTNDRIETEQQPILASPIMKSVWQKLQSLFSSSNHLLLVGEKGVGKKTLITHLLEKREADTSLNIRNISKQALPQHTDHSAQTSDKETVLFIPEIDQSDKELQTELKKWISAGNQQSEDRDVPKIVATSATSLEQAVERGDFDAELYYALSFNTLLIPPLRQRPEDVRAITKSFIQQTKAALRLPSLQAEETDIKQLLGYTWDDNINELFEVLRQSIHTRNNGEVIFSITPKKQSDLFEEENVSKEDVLAFDEMNRRYLKRILDLTDGKIYGDDGAAKLVDLKPTTLQSKLKRLGLR